MKIFAMALLLLIAAGVGYLAYSKYQEREMVKRLALEFANPGSTVVTSWAERAELECKFGVSDIETRQAPGGTIPVRFICQASTGSWTLEEARCTEAQSSSRPGTDGIAKGAPTKVGDIFRPLYAMCWNVVGKR